MVQTIKTATISLTTGAAPTIKKFINQKKMTRKHKSITAVINIRNIEIDYDDCDSFRNVSSNDDCNHLEEPSQNYVYNIFKKNNILE